MCKKTKGSHREESCGCQDKNKNRAKDLRNCKAVFSPQVLSSNVFIFIIRFDLISPQSKN